MKDYRNMIFKTKSNLWLISSLMLTIVLILTILFFTTNPKLLDKENKAGQIIITKLLDCFRKKNTENCSESVAKELLEKYDLETIMSTINNNTSSEEIFSLCHAYPYTRALGLTAFYSQKDVQKVIKQCNGICYEGCYHGVAEAAATYGKSTDVCGSPNQYNSKDEFTACLFGVGSGLLVVEGGDVSKALKLCDLLRKEDEQADCYGGVFGKNNRSITKREQIYNCSTLEKKYQNACFAFGGRRLLEINKLDIEKSLKYCNELEIEYQGECMVQTVGHLVYLKLEEKNLIDACNLISEDSLKKQCFFRVAGYLVQSGEPDRLDKFCSRLEKDYQTECFGIKNQRFILHKP